MTRPTPPSRRLAPGLAVIAISALGSPTLAQDTENASILQVSHAAVGSQPAPPLPASPAPLVAPATRTTLQVIPGFRAPFRRGGVGGAADGDRSGSSPVGFVDFRYSPKENWFADLTLNAYPDGRKRWEPDFTYSFGYDNWRPNTFSLVYANYTNSRFDPRPGQKVTRIEYGTISAGYKFRLPDAIRLPAADAGDEGRIMCRVGYDFTPRYEQQTGPDRWGRHTSSVGCRTPIWRRLFADLTAYQQLAGDRRPWDPDFTYSFGWFDWRPNRLSVQYTNYSGNRYPGRDHAADTGRLKDGSVVVSYNLAF
jgi:hypothetical protein